MVLLQIFEFLVLGLYLLALVCIVIYSLGQIHLVITYLRHHKAHTNVPPLAGDRDLPFVTIQLPIYNELYVVERLLEAVAAMDYPKDSYEIQLLDDSTDETVALAAKKVAELQVNGIDIQHVRRPERVGFKAGALAYGMKVAKGDFIAIFDADFLPKPNFLRATLANFTHERVGVVQTRWEHLNRDYSIFTKAQAFHLDAHFTIEQFSRQEGDYYLNFNGTAGVWRKSCIIDAGGWEADTLTEDLDLSYRAQIKGWKFRYLDEIGSPAELPIEMGAIKSQQYRWMKGGAEVARKMLRRVWQSDASVLRKLHGSMHLLSSSIFLLVLVLGLTSVPLLYLKHEVFHGQVDFLIAPVLALLVSFTGLGVMYLATFVQRDGSFWLGLKRLLRMYLPFLSFSMGLSLHNSIAVLQGYGGKKTPFVRTPKFNLSEKDSNWKHVKYTSRKVKPGVIGELLMALYFAGGMWLAWHFQDFSVMPFFFMEFIGFAAIGFFSFRHALR
jgi:cellulose synthase/poly-beta-1,6-N-acetylglucosamine synthase-like glycosyltransferase